MPPSYDDNLFMSQLPPDVGPATRGGRSPSPGGPPRGPRIQRTEKPKDEKPPEILVADTERLRPPAQLLTNSRQGQKWIIDIEGVLGDLNEDGTDLLIGYIARVNGIGFSASGAYRHRNPGGFGLTLEAPAKISPYHLLPSQGTADAKSWMQALYDFCAVGQKYSDPIERRPYMKPVTFETFEAGGKALADYISLACECRLPYFSQGPMTPIADFLSVFNGPVLTTTTFRWSQLLPLLNEHARTGALTAKTSTTP